MPESEHERILIAEDSDSKYARVLAVVRECAPVDTEIARASTGVEAERALLAEAWSLLVLDISLQIKSGGRVGGGGGMANLGGLSIANKLYLKARELPTVIVTAFDSFEATNATSSRAEIVGLEEIQRRAAAFLGSHLLGCVRYGGDAWEAELRAVIAKAFQ